MDKQTISLLVDEPSNIIDPGDYSLLNEENFNSSDGNRQIAEEKSPKGPRTFVNDYNTSELAHVADSTNEAWPFIINDIAAEVSNVVFLEERKEFSLLRDLNGGGSEPLSDNLLMNGDQVSKALEANDQEGPSTVTPDSNLAPPKDRRRDRKKRAKDNAEAIFDSEREYAYDPNNVKSDPTEDEIADFMLKYLKNLSTHILFDPEVIDNEKRNRLFDGIKAFPKTLAYNFGFGSLSKKVLRPHL